MTWKGEGNAVTIDMVFKIMAGIGGLGMTLSLWLLGQIIALQTEVGAIKKDVDHVPELIELSLMRLELRSANESLQKALQSHEESRLGAAIPMHGGRK